MEKVLLFCVDRGDLVLFTIDKEWFYKFCVFKKRSKRAVKGLGCSSCKFSLLNAAMESVLTVVNSAVAAVQNISESRIFVAINIAAERFQKEKKCLLPVLVWHSLVKKETEKFTIHDLLHFLFRDVISWQFWMEL